MTCIVPSEPMSNPPAGHVDKCSIRTRSAELEALASECKSKNASHHLRKILRVRSDSGLGCVPSSTSRTNAWRNSL